MSPAQQEFEELLENISKPGEILSREDIKRLKEAAFGPQTFWVTETVPVVGAERSGLLVRGNLRDERQKVFEFVCAKVRLAGAHACVHRTWQSVRAVQWLAGELAHSTEQNKWQK